MLSASTNLCSRVVQTVCRTTVQDFSTSPVTSQIILRTRLRVVDNSGIGKQAMLEGKPPKCIHVYNKTGVGTIGDKRKLSTSACCCKKKKKDEGEPKAKKKEDTEQKKKQKKKEDAVFSSTVILPKTTFPLHISPEERFANDSRIAQEGDFEGLYAWQRENRPSDREYILHDGPPYANGRLHLGHAVNKISKDSIIRYKMLRGHRVDYRPGWDCHGLPIELKAITSQSSQISPVEIRQKSKKFAEEAMREQMEGFRSWGIMSDWSEASTYRTFDPEYVKSEMRTFLSLYEKGLIYRDYKPVYWSPSSRSSLAEAELEYNANHTSISVFVRFEAISVPESLSSYCQKDLKVYVPIWTTTPWTLPSNVAISFSPELEYMLAEVHTTRDVAVYVVARQLLEAFYESVGAIRCTVLATATAEDLSQIHYHHPLSERSLPLVAASHVTAEKGTGLVHTAPAHGPEDFEVAQKHSLTFLDLVDECGKFREVAGSSLSGLDVLTSGQDQVLQLLDDFILKREKFVHSYPYDWRTKQPVIYRASMQWFIDTEKIRKSALESLEDVDLKPNSLAHDLRWEVSKRPPWCISRQRSWGVPIPVLYKNGEPVVTREIVDRACTLVDERGIDSWWTCSVDDLVPGDASKYEKNTEIMDIWLDSGLSWLNVLGLEKQADLYLEGVDQCRGWFQSSLLTSIALRGISPYRAVLAHGFVLDENGRKMSKSLGNVIDPEEILKGRNDDSKTALGVDVLRWWALGHRNLADPIRAGDSIFATAADEVQSIRKTFRFLLGSLHHCDGPQLASVPVSELQLVDRYMLFMLADFIRTAITAYDVYDTRRVYSSLLQFVVREVSSFYFWIIKDRLYCDATDSPNRVSALVVLYNLLKHLGTVVSPILPHLTSEVNIHAPKQLGLVCFQKSILDDPNPSWCDSDIKDKTDPIFRLRDDLNTALVGINTVQLQIDFSGQLFEQCAQEDFRYRSSSAEVQLAEIFKVSEVSFSSPSENTVLQRTRDLKGDEVKVTVAKSAKMKCPRCRLFVSDSAGVLCSRCNSVVKSLHINQ